MTIETMEPYAQDPSFQAALRHLQQGDWTKGLAEISALMERYPLDAGLRHLNQVAQLQARVDDDERHDNSREAWRRRRSALARTLLVGLVATASAWALSTYSTRIRQEWAVARASIAHQAEAMELSSKFRDAQALLGAHRPDEALALLQEVAAIEPNYPGLAEAIGEAELAMGVGRHYAAAMGHVAAQEWQAALTALYAVVAEDPDYRDAREQLAFVEKQIRLDGMRTDAEAEFDNGAWEVAAALYERIRTLDPTYRPDEIDARLFESYVRAAQVALIGQADSLEALRLADTYYRRALALRPQDRQVKTDQELAYRFLSAQVDFGQGLWSEVIAGLEYVMQVDPSYASGAARQTLYEAFTARGDAVMKDGDYESALADYEQAVLLAVEEPEGVLRLYEAYIKSAEAQAAQKHYESAVLYYRSAVDAARLSETASPTSPLGLSLAEADQYARNGRFSLALERYRRATRLAGTAQENIAHTVATGEYLLLIASRYGTTVAAIVDANDIVDPSLIHAGQVLLVPVLP